MRVATAMALLLVLAAVGCGGAGAGQRDGGAPGGAGSADGVGSGDAGGGGLTITVVDTPGSAPRTWTLTCDPPGGDHPRPAEACAAIDAVADPFAPVPPDRACTMIYGGPQTATVTGTWRGLRVDASFRRTDGCEIARWEALTALLGPDGTGS